MYRTQKKSFVKIWASSNTSFLHWKNPRAPLGPKKIVFKFVFIGHTVLTKQTINWSEFVGLRYPTKRAQIWWFVLVKLVHAPTCFNFQRYMQIKTTREPLFWGRWTVPCSHAVMQEVFCPLPGFKAYVQPGWPLAMVEYRWSIGYARQIIHQTTKYIMDAFPKYSHNIDYKYILIISN